MFIEQIFDQVVASFIVDGFGHPILAKIIQLPETVFLDTQRMFKGCPKPFAETSSEQLKSANSGWRDFIRKYCIATRFLHRL